MPAKYNSVVVMSRTATRDNGSAGKDSWESGAAEVECSEPVARSSQQFFYFSLATTNSGAHNSARLISEFGNVQIALDADSA